MSTAYQPYERARDLGTPEPAALLLAGVVYQPYYLGTLIIAAGVTWAAPQSWTWSQSIGAAKAVAVLALLVLSTVALTTQAYNPFIYFIF